MRWSLQSAMKLSWLVLAFAATGAHAEYLEGIEYTELNQPQPVATGDKIEVREVFLYGCPHCFHLEPVLQKWVKRLPANARFVRMPAVFRPTLEPHARAFYAFEALGITNKMHEPFFKAIHVQQRPLSDEDSIVAFVVEHGGKAEEFRRTFHSFSVDANVKSATQLAAAYGVDSVPTMIVDGKYRTNSTMAGGNDNLLRVLDYLIKKSADERKRGAKPSRP